MKKIVFFIILIGIIVFNKNASGDEFNVTLEHLTTTLKSEIRSAYHDPNGDLAYDSPVIQTDLFITLPLKFYAGGWHSYGLDNSDPSNDYDDELDFYFGWSDSFTKYKLLLDIGFLYMDLIEIGKMSGDLIGPYGSLAKDFKLNGDTLSPFIRMEGFLPTNNESPSRGFRIIGGIKHFWEINERFDFEQSFDILYDTGSYDYEEAIVGRYENRLGLVVTEYLSLHFGIKATVPTTSVQDRNPNASVGGGITLYYE